MNCESFCLAKGCSSSFGCGVLHVLYLSFFYSLAAVVVWANLNQMLPAPLYFSAASQKCLKQ